MTSSPSIIALKLSWIKYKQRETLHYVQKKNAVSLEKKFALSQFEDLTNKYGKLLGFR